MLWKHVRRTRTNAIGSRDKPFLGYDLCVFLFVLFTFYFLQEIHARRTSLTESRVCLFSCCRVPAVSVPSRGPATRARTGRGNWRTDRVGVKRDVKYDHDGTGRDGTFFPECARESGVDYNRTPWWPEGYPCYNRITPEENEIANWFRERYRWIFGGQTEKRCNCDRGNFVCSLYVFYNYSIVFIIVVPYVCKSRLIFIWKPKKMSRLEGRVAYVFKSPRAPGGSLLPFRWRQRREKTPGVDTRLGTKPSYSFPGRTRRRGWNRTGRVKNERSNAPRLG